jgi:hypothetical protein
MSDFFSHPKEHFIATEGLREFPIYTRVLRTPKGAVRGAIITCNTALCSITLKTPIHFPQIIIDVGIMSLYLNPENVKENSELFRIKGIT